MAKQTIVQFIDDIDGSTADETIEFGIDGKTYEIDLSADNAAELRGALAEYVAAARKSGPARKTRGSAPKTSSGASEARQWLQENGHQVSDRGRIPQDLMDIYNQRHVGAHVVDEIPAEEEPPTDEQEPTIEVDSSPEAIMAWWTGVLKRPEPKSGKVTAPMRKRYLEEHGAA